MVPAVVWSENESVLLKKSTVSEKRLLHQHYICHSILGQFLLSSVLSSAPSSIRQVLGSFTLAGLPGWKA